MEGREEAHIKPSQPPISPSPRHVSHALILWLPPLLWMALIFLGSSLTGGNADGITRQASGVNEPIQIQRIKDAVHITEFGILTLLLLRAFTRRSYRPSLKQTFQAFCIASLYGVSDELHQYFVPSRYPGIDDMIRDVVGAALVAGMVYLMACYRRTAPQG